MTETTFEPSPRKDLPVLVRTRLQVWYSHNVMWYWSEETSSSHFGTFLIRTCAVGIAAIDRNGILVSNRQAGIEIERACENTQTKIHFHTNTASAARLLRHESPTIPRHHCLFHVLRLARACETRYADGVAKPAASSIRVSFCCEPSGAKGRQLAEQTASDGVCRRRKHPRATFTFCRDALYQTARRVASGSIRSDGRNPCSLRKAFTNDLRFTAPMMRGTGHED